MIQTISFDINSLSIYNPVVSKEVIILKKKMSWQMMLVMFFVCLLVAGALQSLILFFSYPIKEIVRALAAAFNIGAFIVLIMAIVEGIKKMIHKPVFNK